MRELEVGESVHDLGVDARNPWNASGLLVKSGERYEFKVEDVNDWRDLGIEADPETGHDGASWVFRLPFAGRRFEDANWFTLVGAVGRSHDHYFPIGRGRTRTMKATGELFTFANDTSFFPHIFYLNNHGTLRLVVTRVR